MLQCGVNAVGKGAGPTRIFLANHCRLLPPRGKDTGTCLMTHHPSLLYGREEGVWTPLRIRPQAESHRNPSACWKPPGWAMGALIASATKNNSVIAYEPEVPYWQPCFPLEFCFHRAGISPTRFLRKADNVLQLNWHPAWHPGSLRMIISLFLSHITCLGLQQISAGSRLGKDPRVFWKRMVPLPTLSMLLATLHPLPDNSGPTSPSTGHRGRNSKGSIAWYF